MKLPLASVRILLGGLMFLACLNAQPATPQSTAGNDSEVRPPVTKADIEIVKRARQILDSPSKWNRADDRVCPAGARTFSIYCALEKATDEVSGSFEHRGAAMQETRFVIDAIAPNRDKYEHRLMGYNNDPTTTFADVQKVFDLVQEHIAKRLKEAPPTVQAAGARPLATADDLRIVKRVREILGSESKWSRADNQICPPDAPAVGLFCAFRMATKEVKGAIDDSNAAMQEARRVISETAPNVKNYSARMVDYNNDPTTTFADLQRSLALMEERLAKRLGAAAPAK